MSRWPTGGDETRSQRGLVVALSCLLAMGCGGPESAGDPSADEPTAHPEGVYGQAMPAINGVRSVVLLTPVDMSVFEPGYPEAKIDQFGLVFSPQRLIVPAGQPMQFTNSEASLSHNVQVWPLGSTTPILDSDALPEDAIDFTPEAGAYDILCDEHPGMRAFLFATDAPLGVFAEADGSFEFGVVPEGDYIIQGWSVEDGFGPEIPISTGTASTGVDVRPSGDGSTG